MLLLILVIIIVLSLFTPKINENYQNQFCKLSNYDNKQKFTPINMILNDIKPFKLNDQKKYIESNIVLSIDEIKKALANVAITKKISI